MRTAGDARTPRRPSLRRHPEAVSAEERVAVVDAASPSRQTLEQLRVASAENDLVRFERGTEPRGHVGHVLAPPLLAAALESGFTDVLLVRLAVLVRQVRQLHRRHDAIDDECRAEAGPEPEKQHPAFLVAA